MSKINYEQHGEYQMPDWDGKERRSNNVNIAQIVGKLDATMAGFKEDLSDLKSMTNSQLKSIDEKIEFHNRKIEEDLEQMNEFREYKHNLNSERITQLHNTISKTTTEFNNKFNNHEDRIVNLETKPDLTRLGFYDKIKDKLIWGFLGALIFAAVRFAQQLIEGIF